MGWKDRYRQASFRGVPFFVDEADRDGGRESIVHRIPERVRPIIEDNGRAVISHAIDAMLLGDGYMEVRDRLLAALEQGGPGTLVHPYLGTLEVSIGPTRLRHDKREGGKCRIGFVAYETHVESSPTESVDTAAAAAAAAADLSDAGEAAFAEGITVEEVPDWTLTELAQEIERLTLRLRAIDLSGGLLAQVAQFTELVNAIGEAAVELVRGGDFPGKLRATFAALEGAFTSKQAAMQAYLSVSRHRAITLGYHSESGAASDANAIALERLVRELAIAGACAAAAAATWDSYEDAIAARELLRKEIDELADGAGDTSYQELTQMRASLYAAVPPEDESLPRLVSLELRAGTSSLLLAYRLFQDLERERDIITRNQPPWPAFLSPHIPVEILAEPA